MILKSILIISYLVTVSHAHDQIKNGLWRTECQNSSKKAQTYSNLKVILFEHFYIDKDCRNQNVRFATTGNVSYDRLQPTFINFTYQDIYLTLYRQNMVDNFNLRRVCGSNEWSPAKAKKITGLRCALFDINSEVLIPATGDRKFGIFRSENNKLYYGQMTPQLDGSSPDKRPVKLNEATEYIFQNSP